ncbi:zinc finger protein 423-like [Galleria mellonella]|uniref:Zinc finger protein 423-like n=1 Tax=Galleria mellonella TaxID=7137 RepID=A0A6J1WZX7_GALME|nr:zinc finger protein 423-like [Galleria mellonella]
MRKSQTRKNSKLAPQAFGKFEEESNEEFEFIPQKILKLYDSNELSSNSKDSLATDMKRLYEDRSTTVDKTSNTNNEITSNDNEETEYAQTELFIENEINKTLKQTLKNNGSLEKILDKSLSDLLGNCDDSTNDNDDDLSYTSLYKVFALSTVDDYNVTANKRDSNAVASGSNTNVSSDVLANTSNVNCGTAASKNAKNEMPQISKTFNENSNDPSLIDRFAMFRRAQVIANTTKNLADRILAIELANSWGYIRQFCQQELKQETLLQDALYLWKNWQSFSVSREVPLSYKCYVCNTAYWELAPFREHIFTMHKDIKIDFETVFKECHIKAYDVDDEIIRNFPIDSNCWRCGKHYNAHPTLAENGKDYVCCFCQQRRSTCATMKIHESLCDYNFMKHLENEPNIKLHYCKLCPMFFWDENHLYGHLKSYHVVRSDMPIWSPLGPCRHCKQRVIDSCVHVCRKKNMSVACPYCYRRFPSKKIVKIHLEITESVYQCRICDVKLAKRCMEVVHVLHKHSDNFMAVYRCQLCAEDRIFLSATAMKDHKVSQHANFFNPTGIYSDIVIVLKEFVRQPSPTKCVSSNSKAIQSNIKNINFPESDNTKIGKELQILDLGSDDYDIFENIKSATDIMKQNNIDDGLNKSEQSHQSNIIDIGTDNSKNKHTDYDGTNRIDKKDVAPGILNDQETGDMQSTNSSQFLTFNINKFKLPVCEEKELYIFEEAEFETDVEHINTKGNHVIGEEIHDNDIDMLSNDDASEDSSVDKSQYVPRIYKCRSCDFESTHQEYKLHINNCKAKGQNGNNDTKKIYKCKNCDFKAFHKLYVKHVETCTVLNQDRKPHRFKLYQCEHCNFEGFKRDYREHIKEHSNGLNNADMIGSHRCTKCCKNFLSLKKYLLHLHKEHNIEMLMCPQCAKRYTNFSTFTLHFKTHIKNMFLSVKAIDKESGKSRKKFKCKKCKDFVPLDEHFSHWESHVEMPGEVVVARTSEKASTSSS